MSAAALPLAPAEGCFHCGLPVPEGCALEAFVEGEWRPMCCPGCQAVAEAIVDQGLEEYYRYRDTHAETAPGGVPPDLALFDDPEVQRDFVERRSGEPGEGGSEAATATFSVEGMRCAACAWLIERRLRQLPGVEAANVALSSHRVLVGFDPSVRRVSELLRVIREIGYVAHPYEPDREARMHEREQRAALIRLGVSGLGTMQVMMAAVALYAGALEGMDPVYRDLMRWTSLIVATFVVTVGARPFFEAAGRDLRARQLGMDVPVALAIGIAYVASAFATFAGTGEVYFDSVCMFTFFLSLGRHLEQRMRAVSDERVRALGRRVPATARRLEAGVERVVPVRVLRRGDRVHVRAGECIPVDGRVLEGESDVSEALWTGEDAPRGKCPGDTVIGGSTNLRGALLVEVERAASEGTLASIRRLLDRAQAEKPPVARLADRFAQRIVAVVLGVAAATALIWWHLSPDDALWITLSVLVATCPCALSLATPAALAAATAALAEMGFLVTRGHVIETLSSVSRFAFDKTGTLTSSELTLGRVVVVDDRVGDERAVGRLVTALEHGSAHPIARALEEASQSGLVGARPTPTRREDVPGYGVAGTLEGTDYRVGRPQWVMRLSADLSGARVGEAPPSPEPPGGPGTWVLLGDTAGPLAWLSFRSSVRDGARAALDRLHEHGIESVLLTGDASRVEVDRVAEAVGIVDRVSGATPADKVAVLESLQERGEVVAAVGDGVNDAPLLGRAQVSIAMAGGADLARVSADAVLLDDRLPALADAVEVAHRTRRIIRQNLIWAVLYNGLALPLAMTGHLPPWLAALGMSASSLVVVLNALRLRRVPEGGVSV